MIRLSHVNTELNKEILQLSQEVDRLRHYDAANNEKSTAALQQQYQSAKQEIRRLKASLKTAGIGADVPAASEVPCDSTDGKTGEHDSCGSHQHNNHGSHGHHDHHSHGNDGHSHDHSHDHSHSHSHGHSHQGHDHNVPDSTDEHTESASVTSTLNIATNEAMDKLQARFKRTMNEIADLTEEKQRLEHLVLQLQSETETIGEYIALYQTQRRLLKRREIEKDIQLHRIAADRQDMKEKLKQLNGLVELLLVQNGLPNAREIMEKLNSMGEANLHAEKTVNGDQSIGELADVAEEAALKQNDTVGAAVTSSLPSHETGGKQETAKKIINLLADIRDKNLKQDFTSVPNDLHHCPCCSGKLEVV